MPVRIYDISKKLGLENKEVLSKAKELGIAEARVASSSLDNITAEYLEQQLVLAHPGLVVASAAPQVAAPAAKHEPIVVVSAPPPEVETAPKEEPALGTATAVLEEEPPAVEAESSAAVPPSQGVATAIDRNKAIEVVSVAPPEVETAPKEEPALGTATAVLEEEPPAVEAESSAAVPPSQGVATAIAEAEPEPEEEPVAEAALPVAPPPPAPPPGPKVGDKVGFIQLPTKAAPKAEEKYSPKPPARPPEPRKTEFVKRADTRTLRTGTTPPGAPQRGPGGPKPAEPAVPRPQLPADAQVISIKPPIVVRELAEQLKQKPFKIIADLMEIGRFANVNQSIEENIAERICAKYGFKFEVEKRERGSGLVHAPVKKVELDIEDRSEERRVG